MTELLQQQEGIIATWQLLSLGLTESAARHLTAQWRQLHRGVWLSGYAPLSQRQRWWGAAATAPHTVLSHASAGAIGRFYSDPLGTVVVSRPGTGRQLHRRGVLICRSNVLAPPDLTFHDGLPATAPARTLVDLSAALSEPAARRAVRDALRVKAVTGLELEAACRRYWHRKGVARLRTYASSYAPLPADRARSDAEVLAMASISGAELPLPELNVKRVGLEADLSWPDRKLIVELDGPSFHSFPADDALRDRRWQSGGWTVVRVSTDTVYDEPARFLVIVRTALARDH